MFQNLMRTGTKALSRAGLLRIALAGAVFALLFAGWPVKAPSWTYLGAALAVVFGALLALGKPRILLQERLAHVLVDAVSVSLLVAGTGGADSRFFALYLLAGLGMVVMMQLEQAVIGAAALAGGYVGAAYASAAGFEAVTLGARTVLILVFCAITGVVGNELRSLRRDRNELSSALAESRAYEEKAASLISELSPLLGILSLDGALRWAAETARELTKAPYVHVAVLDGNHHQTSTTEERDAYPNWWHPEIQKLVLWSCREDRVLREEKAICGMESFIAIPLAPAEGQGKGAIVVGGKELSDREERVLGLLARQTALALERASDSPGGRDVVSGLPSYASLYRVIQRELSHNGTLTVLISDINQFRRYNQAYGLAAGDALLQRLGRRLMESQFQAFRFGGDEFAVVLKGSSRARANRAARTIQQVVIELTSGSAAPLTASVGYAVTSSVDRDPESVLDAALDALGEAKDKPGAAAGAEVKFGGRVPAAEVETPITEAALALVEAAEVRAPNLGVHLRAVSRMARSLGVAMGVAREEIDLLAIGGLLHDIGKIGIPDSILLKAGSLTEGEYEIIKGHPILGARILESVGELSPVVPAVKHHHERFDGRGYPDGLKGEEIPLMARVVFVADAFDSMVRSRPYRYRISAQAALEEIERNSGTQFDPKVVSALRRVIEESEIGRTGTAN